MRFRASSLYRFSEYLCKNMPCVCYILSPQIEARQVSRKISSLIIRPTWALYDSSSHFTTTSHFKSPT
jgi:hypothetical protein